MTWPFHNKPGLGIPIDLDHPLATGLVGYWLMNERTGTTVQDSSGNRNDGTLVADAHFVSGTYGFCLDFDGTGDEVDFAGKMPTLPFTLACYFRVSSITAEVLMSVAPDSNMYYSLRVYGGLLQAHVYTVGSNSADVAISANVWYHAVAVFESTTSRTVYLNGVARDTDTASKIVDTPLVQGRLGVSADTTPYGPMEGQIDHAMMWDRALSASEIAELYREPFAMFKGDDIVLLAGEAAGGETLEATPAEEVTVADSCTAHLTPLKGPVYDAATAADDVTAHLTPLKGTPYDSVTVADDASAHLTPLKAEPYDSLAVVDSVDTSGIIYGDYNEAVTVADAITVSLNPLKAEPYDSATVTDAVSTSGLIYGDYNDAVTVADAITVSLNPLKAEPYDSPTVADDVAAHLTPLKAELSESVTVADNIDADTGTLTADEYDAVTVADAVTAHLTPLKATPYDSLTVTDYVDPVYAGALTADEADDVTVADVVTRVMPDWFGVTSEHLDSHIGDSSGYTLANALDGASRWSHAGDYTHWFIIDLAESYDVYGVRGRSEATGYDPILVDIYVSNSKVDWGDAVASDIATWQDTDAWQPVRFTAKEGRYIKVEITDTESATGGLVFGSWSAPYFNIFDAWVVGPPRASEHDDLTVTDAVTVSLNPLKAEPTETIGVTDAATAHLNPLKAEVYEEITVEDSFGSASTADEYDDITVADAVTAHITPLKAEVYESASVTDSATADAFLLTWVKIVAEHTTPTLTGIVLDNPDADAETNDLCTISSGNILLDRNVDDAYMNGFRSEKDRDGGAVADDDTIGVFRWSAHDGTQMSEAAEIELKVDGTPGDGDMPCRMLLKVSPAGAASAVAAMSILNSGNIGIGETTPAAKLEVKGTTRLGDGGSNYTGVGDAGDMSFAGSAGFYPRVLNQTDEPAAGTGATQCDTGELVVWTDTDDSKCYFCYNHSGTVKAVELV